MYTIEITYKRGGPRKAPPKCKKLSFRHKIEADRYWGGIIWDMVRLALYRDKEGLVIGGYDSRVD